MLKSFVQYADYNILKESHGLLLPEQPEVCRLAKDTLQAQYGFIVASMYQDIDKVVPEVRYYSGVKHLDFVAAAGSSIRIRHVVMVEADDRELQTLTERAKTTDRSHGCFTWTINFCRRSRSQEAGDKPLSHLRTDSNSKVLLHIWMNDNAVFQQS